MATATKRLSVMYHDSQLAEPLFAGQIDYLPDGMLEVADAETGFEVSLDEFVETINGKDVLRVKIPSKKQFSLKTADYERNSPDFLTGIREYARHYFAFELRSPDDLTENPQDFQDLT